MDTSLYKTLTTKRGMKYHYFTSLPSDDKTRGRVILASLVPTVISSPIAGALSDRVGPAWVSVVLLACGVPWCGLLVLRFSLAFFIVAFAVQNFWTLALASPVTTELAAVTRDMDGVGYAHTYGTFNIVYGLGNVVGSVVGGQWDVLCYVNVVVLAACVVPTLLFIGEKPILRVRR